MGRTEWHGGCYREQGSGPEIGGHKNMAVDHVLLHIVIALGVIAFAAHATGSR